MDTVPTTEQRWWLAQWMDAASKEGAMSQRKLSSVIHRGGGLQAAVAAAQLAGLHLLLLTDEHGEQLIAASKQPFKVLV